MSRHVRPWLRFRLGRRGVAAVEFAICLPVLVILLLGSSEMLTLYRTQSKLNQLASNFAEMVSLQINSPVATTPAKGSPGLTDLCQGALDGLQPFPALAPAATGVLLAVASVTETKGSTSSNGVAVSATYGEWEVDLNSSCATTTSKIIGTTGTTGAVTLATGGTNPANAILQGAGDNMIVVRATLNYPGILGLFITSGITLSQTAVTRWRYASSTNVNATSNTTPSTLEFLCSGSNCIPYTCSSSSSCTT